MNLDERQRLFARFRIQVLATHLATSAIAIAALVLMLNSIAEFMLEDFRINGRILAVLVPLAGAIQLGVVHWRAAALRRWVYSTTMPHQEVQAFFLGFPAFGAWLTLALWLGCTALDTLILHFASDMPGVRVGQILLAAMGATMLAVVLQFVIIKLLCKRMIEAHNELRDSSIPYNYASMRGRYLALYSALLIGGILEGGLLSYSVARRHLSASVINELASDIALARSFLAEYPDTYVQHWNTLQAGLGASFSLGVDDPDVPYLSRYFQSANRVPWYQGGLEYFEIERQRIPPIMRVKERLDESTWIYVEMNMQSQQEKMTALLARVVLVYSMLLAMGLGLIWLFVVDFTRALTGMRQMFAGARGTTLQMPPLSYNDDETGLLSVQMVSLVDRVRKRVRMLKDAFWSVRDGKRRLQDDMTAFADELKKQTGANTKYRDAVDRIGQQAGVIQARMDELYAAGSTAQTALLKINETLTTIEALEGDLVANGNTLGTAVERYVEVVEAIGTNSQASARELSEFKRGVGRLEDLLVAVSEHMSELESLGARVHSAQAERRAAITSMQDTAYSIAHEFSQVQSSLAAFSHQFSVVRQSVENLADVKDETDILGFQTTIVASQSPGFQREFLVVADEMKELAERTDSSVITVATRMQKLGADTRARAKRLAQSSEDLVQVAAQIDSQAELASRQLDQFEHGQKLVRSLHASLRQTESVIEQAAQYLREHRQIAMQADQLGDKDAALAHQVEELMQHLQVALRKSIGNAEQQQRYFGGLRDSMPRVHDAILALGKSGRRLRSYADMAQKNISDRERAVQSSVRNVGNMLAVFAAAEAVLNESEERMRQVSRNL